jgi:hypothetical protein
VTAVRRLLLGMVALLMILLAGCGESSSVQPSQSQDGAAPSASADAGLSDDGEIIEFNQPDKNASEIPVNKRYAALGFEVGVPEGWTLREDGTDGFLMQDQKEGKLSVEMAEGLAGKSQEEISEEYAADLQEAGVDSIDSAQELTIGGKSAVGLLYQSADDTLDVSRFLIQDGEKVYDFQFSCLVENTLDFYVYMDAILQSLSFDA